MKKLLWLAGLSLAVVSAARAGVGLGLASELSVTSPLMGGGQAAPTLTLPSANVALNSVYTPVPSCPVRIPPSVVSPLPGASSHAPVAISVGPVVHEEHALRELNGRESVSVERARPTTKPEIRGEKKS